MKKKKAKALSSQCRFLNAKHIIDTILCFFRKKSNLNF